MRRVVVTGIGLVTPLACGAQETWERLLAGQSGASPITRFDASDLSARFACQLPTKEDGEHGFDPNKWMDPKDQKRNDKFIIYGVAAASQAVEDSGWLPEADEDRQRTGVMIGSGIGGIETIYESSIILAERGPRRVSPFFIPSALINLVSGQVSIKYGFRGPNHAVVTACSTGAHAIGDATRLIKLGDADVMVAGGTEAAICKLGLAGFASARALSTRNDDPKAASRPWDKDRDGFVMGEGAGVVILEEYEHAKARGAKIYGEILGYGLSGDAYHITSPHPDGDGGYRSMKAALTNASLGLADVDYINAHGTSTPMGDGIELSAVKRLFAENIDNICMSSTKSSIGHLLGAAGAVETIFCLLAIRCGVVPPTLNLDNVSEDCRGVDLVPCTAQERNIKIALCNSFGFGGTNASLIVGRVET